MSVTCGKAVVFSGTPVSSTNKTDRHDITELLLKVALNTLPPTYLSIVHTQRDGKSVWDVFLYSNFTFECIKKNDLHLKHVFCCSRNLDVYLNQSGSYTPKIIKFKDWIWKLSNHFNNTVELVQSNTWFFFDILWHPTKIYGPKVFLLSKIKPEYSDILYNPTHFLGPLVCPIRQVPM